MKATISLLAAALLVTACNATDSPDADTSARRLPPGNALPPPEIDAAPAGDAWAGRWTGPEGLVLDIEPGAEPGRYTLDITLLDGTNSYQGVAEGGVIAFTRDGKAETIRPATGDATGLKWLAGKQDCLVIQPGEGFCRD